MRIARERGGLSSRSEMKTSVAGGIAWNSGVIFFFKPNQQCFILSHKNLMRTLNPSKNGGGPSWSSNFGWYLVYL